MAVRVNDDKITKIDKIYPWERTCPSCFRELEVENKEGNMTTYVCRAPENDPEEFASWRRAHPAPGGFMPRV